MKNVQSFFGCVCLVLVSACGASGTASMTGVRGMPVAKAKTQAASAASASSATASVSVDASRATNPLTKKCEMREGATQQDLAACLEAKVAKLEGRSVTSVTLPSGYTKALASDGTCVRGNEGASEEDYINCLRMREQTLKALSADATAEEEETEIASSEAASVSSQPTYYIPTATGAVCETNPQLVLTVTNRKVGHIVTVAPSLNGTLVPFHCDAPVNLVIVPVTKKSGQNGFVRAILPGQTARFVFLPHNGGLGKVEVTYTSYLYTPTGYGQPQVASREIAAVEYVYNVPNQNNYQVINDAVL